jgi:hypothetical protein
VSATGVRLAGYEGRAVGVRARDLSIGADDHGRVAQACRTRPNIPLARLRPCFLVINCLIGSGEGWIEILSGSLLQAENPAVRVAHGEDAIGRNQERNRRCRCPLTLPGNFPKHPSENGSPGNRLHERRCPARPHRASKTSG